MENKTNREIKELTCAITSDYQTPSGGRNVEYAVWDGQKVVASGVSSDPSWVKHDAGGYHTKEKFDEKYPEGWKVLFNF